MSDANVLIGKYFHSFDENGRIKWQGQIIGHIAPSAYVVQLFEWIAGFESIQKVVDVNDLYGWVIYESDDDMRRAYYSKQAIRMRHENDPHHHS